MRDTMEPVVGSAWYLLAGLSCPTCHLVSVDNEFTPTYKFELPGYQLLDAALHHQTRYRWIHNLKGIFLRAAADAAAGLTTAQGANPSKWNEPAEQTVFSPQGAISVPPITPLQNRGSYGQVIEAKSAPR